MRRGMLMAWLLGLLGAMPLSAQETMFPRTAPTVSPDGQLCPVAGTVDEVVPWQTAWGLVGLRIIPAGPKIAPNGELYHPNFSMDLNFNCWLWRSQGLYLFADMRLWGEKGEYGVVFWGPANANSICREAPPGTTPGPGRRAPSATPTTISIAGPV